MNYYGKIFLTLLSCSFVSLNSMDFVKSWFSTLPSSPKRSKLIASSEGLKIQKRSILVRGNNQLVATVEFARFGDAIVIKTIDLQPEFNQPGSVKKILEILRK